MYVWLLFEVPCDTCILMHMHKQAHKNKHVYVHMCPQQNILKRTHAHTNARTYKHTQARTQACIDTQIHIQTDTHASTHMLAHTYLYKHTQTQVHAG